MGRPRDAYQGSVLTKVQADILKMTAKGYQARDIAAARGTTNATVQVQLAGIRQRLHARTIAHAVAQGFHFGILEIEPLDEAAG